MPSSSSTFNFLQTQNAKYHTDKTTTNACTSPNEPAFKISEKITPVPSSTSPIFTNNSVDKALRNHSGSLNKLPSSNPIDKLKITASRLIAFILLLPAIIRAIIVRTYTTGNTRRKDFNGFCVSNTPGTAIAKTRTNCIPIIARLETENTLPIKSSLLFHPKAGTGSIKPERVIIIIKKPKSTTVQSSDNSGCLTIDSFSSINDHVNF